MSTEKHGPLKRLARALGLGKTTVGAYGTLLCWACDFSRCGAAVKDNRCSCCRANHFGPK